MKFFRYLLLSLVLVMVALVSALTAMRYAIHGREVEVPNLIGKTLAEARHLCTATGLTMEAEGRFYSVNVPEGRIVSQAPPPGATVRRAWRVRVAESLGPQRVSIPDVTGSSSRAAEINIRRRGLDLGAVATVHLSGEPADQVIAQQPPPNASGISSPTINLLVSAAPEPQAYVMPDLAGMPSAAAIRALQDAGMRLAGMNDVTDADLPPGTVARQAPAPGQKVSAGTGVTLYVTK
ncbi:MAG: PASTA domain-containing protein [Acidobacteria bacterium]|nr:PASTA domain-containing protein [Acidobacteriota bacterium]